MGKERNHFEPAGFFVMMRKMNREEEIVTTFCEGRIYNG
jgi:hypothetical protein